MEKKKKDGTYLPVTKNQKERNKILPIDRISECKRDKRRRPAALLGRSEERMNE